MQSPLPGAAHTELVLGKHVARATQDVFTGAEKALFNVVGGRVLVTQLLGEVTTIVQNQACNFKFQANPTTGTTNDLSADVSVQAAEVGTLISLVGTAATATVLGKSGGVIGMTSPMVVAVGTIACLTSADNTGSAKFDVWYVPLDEGAYIEAA